MTENKIRNLILQSQENIIISAGAGSGKTTILTNKILKDVEENKSHYKIAAITFTNKAADEIKEKLKEKSIGNFIGTNDSFIQKEIIAPFIKDAYGVKFSNEFSVVYNSKKFCNYNDGLELLKNEKILGSYEDKKKNFKFELALNILRKSKVARQYIKAKYSRIYIDEYQDSDVDMHELFMYIKELGIKLFIVGDINQSIYSWRGAEPQLFKDIYNDKNNGFNKYRLTENFRCSVGIQNYANIILYKKKSAYKENSIIDVIGVYEKPLKYVNINNEIAILVRKNKDAEIIQEYTKEKGMNFVFIPKTPLDKLGTENKNILMELAKYVRNPLYTHYDFINNIPGQFNKTEILEIKEIIKKLKGNNITPKVVEDVLLKLFAYLGLKFYEDVEEIEIFYDSAFNNKYQNSFNGKVFKHKIMTIHSAKGLEFNQVIMFAKDFDIDKDSAEHYVAVTRAKEKLVIVMDNCKYLKSIKKLCSNIELDFNRIIKINR